jgi:hypothetical protein
VTTTLRASAEILRYMYSDEYAAKVRAEQSYFYVLFAIALLRGVTYEHRDRLAGQAHAARRLAIRRRRTFDASAWWKAHRP